MTTEELEKRYYERYKAEIDAGSTIKIDDFLPYVGIEFSNGDEFFFQGEEAENLLAEVPEWCNAEVYLLATAQGW